jgi:hypothetical protein
MLRNAGAELRALAPARLALATLPGKTEAQQAQQLALAEAFREAAYRFELASREPGGLARSGLLIGPAAEQARLIAEAEAYRLGADDMARGMSRSPFFQGVVPADVLADLRRRAPEAAGTYLNGLALLAGVAHLPDDYLPEEYRYGTLRALGSGFVAATGGVDQNLRRWLLPSLPGDVAQWNALHRELRAIALQGMSPRDAQAVQEGVYEETGRQFLPDTLSLLTGGLFGAVGAAARAPIRITPDILDDAGRFLGQKNAGANAPLFSSWLSKAENVAEILPGGQVRYTTTITDPASSLNGRSVSVSCSEGVRDVWQLGVARVDIPSPVGRGVSRGGAVVLSVPPVFADLGPALCPGWLGPAGTVGVEGGARALRAADMAACRTIQAAGQGRAAGVGLPGRRGGLPTVRRGGGVRKINGLGRGIRVLLRFQEVGQ